LRGRNDEDDDDMMLLLPRFFAEEEDDANPVVRSRFARGEMKDFIQLKVFQSFAIQRNARILLTRMSGVTAPSERGETQRRKKTTECENLGWLASGSCLPRKRKPIENITHSSLVFLEAEKAKLKSETAFRQPSSSATTTEETTTKRGKRPTTKKRIISNAKRELLKENKGVRERNGKDVRDEEREKTTLETKASLYEKLSKDDDLGGTTTMKIPKDGFECMDFKRKRLEEKEKEEYEYDFGSAYERRRYAGREDEDEDEEERERNEFREQRRREDEEREAREFRDEEMREKERRLVEDVARETEAARREREEAKMETVEAREKLKRKFIEEKIAQLKEKKRLEKKEKKKVKTKEAK
jgi:hypothetical protein